VEEDCDPQNIWDLQMTADLLCRREVAGATSSET